MENNQNQWLADLLKSVKALFGGKQTPEPDPIAMIENNIKELKIDLTESMKGLAEVKASYIRSKKVADDYQKKAQEYEAKAVLSLQKAQNGEITPAEADKIALQMLGQKEEFNRRYADAAKTLVSYENMTRDLEGKISKMRDQINAWEYELQMYKTKSRVNQATKNLYENFSKYGNQLDTLKDKSAEQDALLEAYTFVNDGKTSTEREIDRLLGLDGKNHAANPQLHEALNQLKQNTQLVPPNSLQPSDVPPPSNLLSELDKLKEKLK